MRTALVPPAGSPKIFLSHRPEEREFVEELVLLLAGEAGLRLEDIAYSSSSRGTPDMASDRVPAFLPRETLVLEVVSRASLSDLHTRRLLVRRIRERSHCRRTIWLLLDGVDPTALGLDPAETRRADTQPAIRSLLEELLVELGRSESRSEPSRSTETERRISRVAALARGERVPGSRRQSGPVAWRTRLLRLLAGTLGVGVVALIWWLLWPRPGSAPRYGFESGSEGWQPAGRCLKLELSDQRAIQGRWALVLRMALARGSPGTEMMGEAWVDLTRYPPPGVPAPPLDLTSRRVTAWVYAPRGAAGDRKHPNGLQLFVKDAEWRSEYGPWHNVEEERWVRLVLDVGRGRSAYVAPGFDPSRVVAVGVKMASGKVGFDGPVYLDAVDW